MSRKGKQVLKALGVLYLVGVIAFLLSFGRLGRYRHTRPVLIEDQIDIPQRPGFDSDKAFGEAALGVVRAGFLTRGPNAGLEANTVIGRDEIARLIEANPGRITVWNTRLIRESASKALKAGEDFRDEKGTIIAGIGDALTDQRLIKMALAYDQRGGEARHDRIWVLGTGSIVGFDLTLAFTGLNFLVLVVLLYSVLWEPVTRLLDDRAKTVREDIDAARHGREEAESLRETRTAELGKIREGADRLREEARARGEAERAGLVEEARAEARRIAERAARSVASDTERARKEVANEIGALSVELAAKLLGREVTLEDHERLMEEFIGSLEVDADAEERGS